LPHCRELRPSGQCFRRAPDADAAEALGRDARDEPRLVAILRRRELDVRTEIATRELLEQGNRAALGNTGASVHHDVFAQAHRAQRVGQHGQRDARIVAHVLRLAPLAHVPDHELVAFDVRPHDRHVRTTIRVERREMGERRRVDDRSHRIWNLHRVLV